MGPPVLLSDSVAQVGSLLKLVVCAAGAPDRTAGRVVQQLLPLHQPGCCL